MSYGRIFTGRMGSSIRTSDVRMYLIFLWYGEPVVFGMNIANMKSESFEHENASQWRDISETVSDVCCISHRV